MRCRHDDLRAAYAGADAAGAALAGRDLRDGGHRGAGPRAAGDRERGRRRARGARATATTAAPPGCWSGPGDPDALAGALRRWLEDPRRRRRLRRSAGLRRLTLPTWSRTTAQVATRAGGGAMTADAWYPSEHRRSSLSRPSHVRWTDLRTSRRSMRGGRVLRVAAGLVVLGFLVWQLGTGPFVDGLRATSPWAVLVALVVTAGDDVVLRRALVAGLGAVRRAGAAADGVRRLLPLAADQRDAARRRRRRRAPWRAARLARACVWERGLGQAGAGGAGRRAGCCPVAVRAGSGLARAGRGWRVAGGAVVLPRPPLAVAGHLVVFLVAAAVGRRRRCRRSSCCRSGRWCCSARRSRSTSPAGDRARASPRGRSPRPARRAAVGLTRRGDLRRARDWSPRCPGCSC